MPEAPCPDLLAASEAVAPIPRGADDAPVFAEPWQASAFALTLALHARGVFTWSEWAQALSGAIRAAQAEGDPDLGETYWAHWLGALESLLAAKGLAAPHAVADRAEAWRRAAEATPHGTPITLQNDPLRAG